MNIKKNLILSFLALFSFFVERPLLSMEDASALEYSYNSDSDEELSSLDGKDREQLEKLVKPLAKQAYKRVENILFDRRGPLRREDRSNLRRFFRNNGAQIKDDFEEGIEGVLFGTDGLHAMVSSSDDFGVLVSMSNGVGYRVNVASELGKQLFNKFNTALKDYDDDYDWRDAFLGGDDRRKKEAKYKQLFSGLASSKLETLIKDPRASWQKLRDRSNVCWKTTYSVFKWASFSAISLLGAGGFLDLVTHHSVPGTASVLTFIVLLSLWCKHIK